MKKLMLVVAAAAVVAAADAATAAKIDVYQTRGDGGEMKKLDASSVVYESSEEAWMSPVVDLDAAKPSHPYLGLGGSFAEASCAVLAGLPAERRREILEVLFTDKGVSMSVGRLHVGSSDYSVSLRTYDDGPEDPTLSRFSIDGDRKLVLPVVKEAMAVRPDIYFFSSTWTPPGWMKTNKGLNGGWMKTKWLGVYCDYYVKFLQAYRAEGIDVQALTVQNEPQCGRPGSPTCRWNPDQEAEVVGRLLPPRLKAAGLSTKIWLWDHNYDGFKDVLDMLADPDVLRNVDAVAWHPYCGSPEMLEHVRARHPGLRFQQTEVGPTDPKGVRSLAWWCDTIFGAFNHGCSSFVNWCIALDPEGFPNTSEGLYCEGLVSVDRRTGAWTPSDQYRVFRHIGPFVKRGASILKTGFTTDGYYPNSAALRAMAFRNPDGSDVIVVGASLQSDGARHRRCQFQFKKNGRYHVLSVPVDSVMTFCVR